jgi:hypothetical protein
MAAPSEAGAAMMAASAAVAPVLTGPRRRVEVAVATPTAVYLTAGDAVVCLATPEAVRVPCAVLVRRLPVVSVGTVGTVGGGELTVGPNTFRVGRWWRPPRPTGLSRVADLRAALGRGEVVLDTDLVGRGPGLTPFGDDVLAGALVTLRALGSPRADALAASVLRQLHRTTVVSAALLRHAARGECIPELAAVLAPDAAALPALLAVGHSSGRGLALGVQAALSPVDQGEVNVLPPEMSANFSLIDGGRR